MFTPIIGLEIHLQLKTKSKVFCRCSALEAEPNTNICPICLGYPGAMPDLNREAVLQAIRMGLVLNCKIAEETNWDRKSYMYPDLFKGYQISQLGTPICGEGEIEVIVHDRRNYYSGNSYAKKISIFRAHLEEDTAKSIHESDWTLLDANKAGIPLLEIVSAPEMNTVDEAVSYAKTIRNLARWFGICDGNLELGQMRFDANISIQVEGDDVKGRKYSEWPGSLKFTPIVEIKNLNSFGNLQAALDYEIQRQIDKYNETHEVYFSGTKETRGWDEKNAITYTQRKKEEANEYRFLPEPDIPTLIIHSSEVEKIKEEMPNSPAEEKERLVESGIPEHSAEILTEENCLLEYYRFLIQENEEVQTVIANIIINQNSVLKPLLTQNGYTPFGEARKEQLDHLTHLKRLFNTFQRKQISLNELKSILSAYTQNSQEKSIENLLDLALKEEKVDIRPLLEKAFQDNSDVVKQIRSGKDSAKMFFVGIVMRETKGKADVEEVKRLIDELLLL